MILRLLSGFPHHIFDAPLRLFDLFGEVFLVVLAVNFVDLPLDFLLDLLLDQFIIPGVVVIGSNRTSEQRHRH
jgi:hypothetical protein